MYFTGVASCSSFFLPLLGVGLVSGEHEGLRTLESCSCVVATDQNDVTRLCTSCVALKIDVLVRPVIWNQVTKYRDANLAKVLIRAGNQTA